MTGIREFRSVMEFAGQVARNQGVSVSPEYVAFALAVLDPEASQTSTAVIQYGQDRGWPRHAEATSLIGRLLPHRRPGVEPGLQREIERAAAGGAPDVRVVLRTLYRAGELDGLDAAVTSTGQTIQEWLGEPDG